MGLSLKNANASERNKKGIDLIDWENRMVIQVSVTCSPKSIREKIRSSICKYEKPEGEWKFFFVPITNQAPEMKSTFKLPEGLRFNEKTDVLGISQIMALAKEIDKLRQLSEMVDKYGKREQLKETERIQLFCVLWLKTN